VRSALPFHNVSSHTFPRPQTHHRFPRCCGICYTDEQQVWCSVYLVLCGISSAPSMKEMMWWTDKSSRMGIEPLSFIFHQSCLHDVGTSSRRSAPLLAQPHQVWQVGCTLSEGAAFALSFSFLASFCSCTAFSRTFSACSL